MLKPLIVLLAMAASGPVAAETLLGNAVCRATTDPASRVVAQMWGGDQVRVIDRTTGWVKIDRGDRGCWVSVGLVARGASPLPPRYDRGAIREQSCACRGRHACVDQRGRRYCITDNGKKRRR